MTTKAAATADPAVVAFEAQKAFAAEYDVLVESRGGLECDATSRELDKLLVAVLDARPAGYLGIAAMAESVLLAGLDVGDAGRYLKAIIICCHERAAVAASNRCPCREFQRETAAA